MSWGSGIKAGVQKASESGAAIVPYAANDALTGIVALVYWGLPSTSSGPVALRADLARLHAELLANTQDNLSDAQERALVLSNLVSTFNPSALPPGPIERASGPGQKINIGSAAGQYSPMIPAIYQASRVPLAQRAGDLLERARNWAEMNPGQVSPELFSDVLGGLSTAWNATKEAAAEAAASVGESVAGVYDPMNSAIDDVLKAGSNALRWVGLGLVVAGGLWLATKKGGGRAGDPWE